MRTRNFRVQNDLLERGSVTNSQKKERKLTLRGKWESVFSGRHINIVRKETHEVSFMTDQPLETLALSRDEKDDRLLPHPIRRRTRVTVKKATKRKALSKEVRFCADTKCKNPSCKFWHPPVCQNYKSEEYVHGD